MPAKKVMVRARLFSTGRFQVVRLPKDFRFPGDEVTLRREGDSVVMEPVRKRAWPRGYWKRLERARGVGASARPMQVTLGEVDVDQP